MSCTGRTDVRIIHRFCNERQPLQNQTVIDGNIFPLPENKTDPGKRVGGSGEGGKARAPFPLPPQNKAECNSPQSVLYRYFRE